MKLIKYLKFTAVTTALCAGMLFPMVVNAEPDTFHEEINYTEKEVPVYRKSLSEEETFTCYYFDDMPNVPYASYENFIDTFYKLDQTITAQGEGKYFISRKDKMGDTFTAVLDTENEILTVEDTAQFFSVVDEAMEDEGRSEEVPVINKKVDYTQEGTVKEKVYDYSKNGIDLRTINEQPVMPLASLSDLYGNTNNGGTIVIYNGEKIYFNGSSLTLDCGTARAADTDIIQPLLDGNRPEDMIEFNYKEICFVIENMYGYPNNTYPFSNRVKSVGLDAALTEMDPLTKEYLLSSDPSKYTSGLNRLLSFWLSDGGHTGIGFMELVTAISDPTSENYSKNMSFAKNVLTAISDGGEGTVAWAENDNLVNYRRMNIKNICSNDYPPIRAEAYGLLNGETQGIIYKGDTAVIFFNQFTYDGQGWVDYYNNVDAGKEGIIPDDTYGFFQKSMREISQHPEIKIIVIDVSLNGGGVDVMMFGVIDLLFGSNRKSILDQATGVTSNFFFTYDRNLDGVFDEKDKEVDYSKYNYAVLISSCSFSCGNLFPACAKEQGAMILGETSGGGSCTVSMHTTADGLNYQISSQKMLIHPSAINGVLDEGVAPDKATFVPDDVYNELVEEGRIDELIAQMLKAYDIDAMSEAIKQFYGETEYQSEWVDGVWYGEDHRADFDRNGQWEKDEHGCWIFTDSLGWSPKNTWQKIDGKYYFFDTEGIMEKNAYHKGYYLTRSGAWDGKKRAVGWVEDTKGWKYALIGGGCLKNTWMRIDGKWYYFDTTGYMATGWRMLNSKWYYFGKSGAMADGWKKINGKWYFFNNGAMKTGWLKDNEKWYYLMPNGAMATGERTIKGVVYTFDKSGAWIEPAEEDFQTKLENLDGVIKVEKITLDESATFFSEKYLVTFEQSLDWSNPEKGTFPQRVLLGIREGASVNVLETYGYCLPDKTTGDENVLKMDLGIADLVTTLGGNMIMVESRFSGDSRPEGMTNDDLTYWEYLTAENAANDYHRIYQSLSPLMGDVWAGTGSSRGGLNTNVYAYFFPEDMKVYVPYVAPCANSMKDDRMYKYVYTEIGNSAYGEEQAKEMRDCVTAFQVELMRKKDLLLPKLEAYIESAGLTYRDGVTTERLYDLSVLEFSLVFWQYQMFKFSDLDLVLNLPEETEEQCEQKLSIMFTILTNVQKPDDYATKGVGWPYYVNTATTYGQYYYDFSYLREALKEAGLEDKLSVTEDMQETFIQDTVFTEEQKAAFTYDGSFYEALTESIDTTTAKHLMIYGGTDPWYSVRIKDSDNPNVKIYVHPTGNHTTPISSMPEEMKEEIMDTLETWLTEEQN